jgi:hypothetical protein
MILMIIIIIKINIIPLIPWSPSPVLRFMLQQLREIQASTPRHVRSEVGVRENGGMDGLPGLVNLVNIQTAVENHHLE